MTSGLPPRGKSDERGSPDRRTHRDAGEVTVGGPPPDSPSRRGRHHPRPGIYNAVSRSDLWALPALGTGHRLGIQNAPAGGLSKIRKKERKTHNPREGWENGTPPPHRDFKERSVVR